MNPIVERAARDLFSTGERRTRDIKYFFRAGENTAAQLADYRSRAIAQIDSGLSVEDLELDAAILD